MFRVSVRSTALIGFCRRLHERSGSSHGFEEGGSLSELGLAARNFDKGFSSYGDWFRVAKGRFEPDVEA